MEDNLLKYFPEQIEQNKGFITGLETDMQILAQHPHLVVTNFVTLRPPDGEHSLHSVAPPLPAEVDTSVGTPNGFVGMEDRGDVLTDKENAGAALLDACKEVTGLEPVQIGSYRGFSMSVTFDAFEKTFSLTLKGKMTHRVDLGKDPRGNLVRIDNTLDKMPERLETVKSKLENRISAIKRRASAVPENRALLSNPQSAPSYIFENRVRIKLTLRIVEMIKMPCYPYCVNGR